MLAAWQPGVPQSRTLLRRAGKESQPACVSGLMGAATWVSRRRKPLFDDLAEIGGALGRIEKKDDPFVHVHCTGRMTCLIQCRSTRTVSKTKGDVAFCESRAPPWLRDSTDLPHMISQRRLFETDLEGRNPSPQYLFTALVRTNTSLVGSRRHCSTFAGHYQEWNILELLVGSTIGS